MRVSSHPIVSVLRNSTRGVSEMWYQPPTLWAPWNMALHMPNPSCTHHTVKTQTSNTVSLTLYCITICVGIAQEDFIYCWFQPILVVLFSIDNVVFLQRALVSVDVGSAMSLLVSSMPSIAGYAKVMEKLPKVTGALMGKTYGWKMISQMRRQLMVLLKRTLVEPK